MSLDISKYRQVPEEGHTLILFETTPGHRTFSDYPNIVSCCDALTELYEQRRSSAGESADNYTIEDIMGWISQFHKVEMYVFDKEISRYKRNKLDEIRTIFVETLSKLVE